MCDSSDDSDSVSSYSIEDDHPMLKDCELCRGDSMFIYFPEYKLDTELYNSIVDSINLQLLTDESRPMYIQVYKEMSRAPSCMGEQFLIGNAYYNTRLKKCNNCKFVIPLDMTCYASVQEGNPFPVLCQSCWSQHNWSGYHETCVCTGIGNLSDWVYLLTAIRKYKSGNYEAKNYVDLCMNLNPSSEHYKKLAENII